MYAKQNLWMWSQISTIQYIFGLALVDYLLLYLSYIYFFLLREESSAGTSSSDGKEQGHFDEENPFFDAEEQDAEIRKNILDAALQHVPELGWSSEAIEAGAQTIGLSAMAEGMFPRGAGDLVLHFTEDCNVRLADYLVSESRVEKDSEKDHCKFDTF